MFDSQEEWYAISKYAQRRASLRKYYRSDKEKARHNTPEMLAYKKAYRQRPDVKERKKSGKYMVWRRVYQQSRRRKKLRREFERRPEIRQHFKEYYKIYRKKPTAIATKHAYGLEYEQRPHVKAYKRAYSAKKNRTPEWKSYLKKFYQRPEIKILVKASRKKYLNTPRGKIKNNLYCHAHRSMMNLPIDPLEVIALKNSSPLCLACGKFIGCENLTVDHIIPLIRKGARGYHHISNLGVLCLECNSRKGNRTLPSFEVIQKIVDAGGADPRILDEIRNPIS